MAFGVHMYRADADVRKGNELVGCQWNAFVHCQNVESFWVQNTAAIAVYTVYTVMLMKCLNFFIDVIKFYWEVFRICNVINEYNFASIRCKEVDAFAVVCMCVCVYMCTVHLFANIHIHWQYINLLQYFECCLHLSTQLYTFRFWLIFIWKNFLFILVSTLFSYWMQNFKWLFSTLNDFIWLFTDINSCQYIV